MKPSNTERSSTPFRPSTADFETALRTQSLHARQTPSARLRQQTLASLHDSPLVESPLLTRFNRNLMAAAALCACAVLAAIIAFTLPQSSTLNAPIVSKNDSQPASGGVIDEHRSIVTKLQTVRFSQPAALKNPLMTEARLLADDARQTWTTFRAGLPRTLRYDAATPQSSKTSPAVIRQDGQ